MRKKKEENLGDQQENGEAYLQPAVVRRRAHRKTKKLTEGTRKTKTRREMEGKTAPKIQNT